MGDFGELAEEGLRDRVLWSQWVGRRLSCFCRVSDGVMVEANSGAFVAFS